MRKRVGCALLGGMAGGVVGLILQKLGVPPALNSMWGLGGMIAAVWYAERREWIPSGEEVHRPLSLFGTQQNRSEADSLNQ